MAEPAAPTAKPGPVALAGPEAAALAALAASAEPVPGEEAAEPAESAGPGGTALGRVTHDLNHERGPDVLLAVDVPAAWLLEGATVEIELPRLLSCAGCEGGGCDACRRRGAFSRADCSEGGDPVSVGLPSGQAEAAVAVRIPGRGACAAEGAPLPPGHMLVTVRPDHGDGPPASNLRRIRPTGSAERLSLTPPLIAMLVAVVGFLLLWKFLL